MGRERTGVRLARIFYGAAGAIFVVVAVGAVAPAFGGCRAVFSLGPPGALSPVGVNPAPQSSPGPSVPGAAPDCVNYIDVALPLAAVILGAMLLLTAFRLGQEPRSWGATIAVGAFAGIVAALGAAYTIVGIATSDQPRTPPGLGLVLIAALPVLAALASALAVWRASRERGSAA